jgi:hypothetical protein
MGMSKFIYTMQREGEWTVQRHDASMTERKNRAFVPDYILKASHYIRTWKIRQYLDVNIK